VPDDPYSLSDLARLADVTPRTVRYYVSQGLLPAPDAAGPATRYGEAHLARLRLIRRLQRDHLPLSEIRARLERMGDDEVTAAVEALGGPDPEPSQEPGETLAFVRSLMASSGLTPASGGELRAPASPLLMRSVMAPPDPVASEPAAPPVPPAPSTPSTPASASPGSPAQRSTWERLVITADVELHVRRPLDRRTNKRVDQLERIARELLEDDK
jgi:DNA-binding transcriptional MerR regulator